MDSADLLGRRVALASIATSGCLAVLKILVGMRAHSVAVVSDGLESAGDVFASGLVFFGLLVASKPPDKDHPYGHGRFEILTGLGVGVLLTMAGALISFSALQNVSQVHSAPQAFAMWALLLSIAAKTTLWLVKGYYGRRIHSAALLADASNDGADVLSASVALGALGMTLLNPQRFAPADHIGGAIVGIIVILLGMRVIYETSLQLMDTMPDETMLAEIGEAALAVPGALGIEKCFARKTGLRWHVDLHLEVDPEMTVQQSHDIATQVREHIREKLDWVADVLVHVEPHMMGTILSRARR